MADAVATQTILDGPKYAVLKFTNISDGTGESAVTGHHDYTSFGGIPNNAGSGVTGDIQFTTVGHDNTDTYTVILYLRKEY